MLNSLRNRLFASYIIVLVLALGLATFIMIASLSQREAPPEFTWQRLELLLTGFTSREFLRDLNFSGNPDQTLMTTFNRFADNNGVRVMLVATGETRTLVLYDSDEIYSGANSPIFQLEAMPTPDNNNNQGRQNDNNDNSPVRNDRIRGQFTDDAGDNWLFVGVGRDINRPRIDTDSVAIIIAEPRSTASIQASIASFANIFLRPLIQSACLAGVIAFLLAILLSRSIVKPLQVLSKSAQQVAIGEYSETVPETGPAEIKQVATAFNRMTGEVLATQQSQREFMANVSHDLKTPLTSIQGFSQAIIDGAAKNPADAAKVIHDEAERLNRMVQELTDLARLQAGRLSMKMTELNVDEIVSAIGYRMSLVAENKNITLQVETSSTPSIAADGDRLVQVLTNIVGNSIKYTPDGGHIWVTTGVRDGGVEIIVKDNGMGIPAEDLPRIFDRFYQVDKSRGPSRGTGLGLAITQEIVQAHGGKIHITSSGVNQGTTVTIWLPSPKLSTMVMRRVTAE